MRAIGNCRGADRGRGRCGIDVDVHVLCTARLERAVAKSDGPADRMREAGRPQGVVNGEHPVGDADHDANRISGG